MRKLDVRTEQFLLGRALRADLPPIVRQAFSGRRVLITGAGGSVGSELARQLVVCRPAEVVLVDYAEYLLFRTASALHDVTDVVVHPVLADVSRVEDMTAVCREYRPDFIFHAAAVKHVTIAERCIVPAVRTNVLGAAFTAQAAAEVGARFILVSTDKAAEPHSVMGATKRLAELCVLDERSRTGAIAVRFGNVLGSSGSVVEVLMDAARAGRPLTVTDPGATRFFMTAAEAASLVLKAAVSGKPGDVFWLDMGTPLRLADLVSRILDVVTPAGSPRAPIQIVGLRPGEKRNEELTTGELAMEPTEDLAIWRARQSPYRGSVAGALEQLRRACASGDAELALLVIEKAVIDYTPSAEARAAAHRASCVASGESADPVADSCAPAVLTKPSATDPFRRLA
jgi:FlaA1/EpsC-like NDP-sugar epimerase